MKHVKSNLNILKANKIININLKPSKSNKHFKKSSTTLQIIENNLDLKTISNNNYFNFFDKSCKNSVFNSIIFSSNKNSYSPLKNNNYNKITKNNKINYNNSCNTINNNNVKSDNRGISIRLNFKNKIVNNNFIKKNKTSTKKNNNLKNLNINNNNNFKYDFNINERIKEKDKQITLLQKDLLQSQKLLNQLQEEKQKEISSTYNTIKNVDNIFNYNNNSIKENNSVVSKYSSLNDFFVLNNENKIRIFKTIYGKRNIFNNRSNSKKKIYGINKKNINKKKNNLNLYINTTSFSKFKNFNNNLINQNNSKNFKTRNNIHKKYNLGNFNSGPNSYNKKSRDLSQTKLMRLLSYSPNKMIPSYINGNFDFNSKNTLRKNINNYNIIHDIMPKSPSSAQNRVNNKKIINIINDNKNKDLKYIIHKGEDLKKRTQNLLDNYILLSKHIKENIANI